MVLHFYAPITETKIIFTYTKTEAWFWVLGWFLSILTIIGNGLYYLPVYNKRRLRKKTNAFVVSLAVADLCVGISVFPLLFLYEITRDCSYSRSLQKGMLIVRWLFQDASVVNLCSLVLERFIAIVKPYKYVTFMARRRVVQMIFVIWKITVIFILLKSSLWICLNLSSLLNIFIWFVVIFFEFITCCMVIFCLVFMLRIVLKQNRAVTILTRQLSFSHRVSHKPYQKSAVLIMAVVSGLLVVCNVPYLRCGFAMQFF